jgi:hypothetical protein
VFGADRLRELPAAPAVYLFRDPAFLFGCTAGWYTPAAVAFYLILPRMWFFGDAFCDDFALYAPTTLN